MARQAWETCIFPMQHKVDFQDPTTLLMWLQSYSTEELNFSPRVTHNTAGIGDGLDTGKLKDMLAQ